MGSRRVCCTCFQYPALVGSRKCDECQQRRTPGVAALDDLAKVTAALDDDDG
jgi:hypothetical protein